MLPVKGSPENINTIVDYLKTKATGVTLDEAKATIDKSYLDGRKISSYVAWGLITNEDDVLKLTDLGRRMGRSSTDNQSDLFGEIILNIRAYRIAAEWIFHNDLSLAKNRGKAHAHAATCTV
jgi:hypothetical protein